MNTKSAFNVFLTIALIMGFASCKKESNSPPVWFTTHSRFYYDISTDTSTLPSHVLSVGPGLSADALFFNELPVDPPITSYYEYLQIFGSSVFKLRADGIYGIGSNSCGFGGSLGDFDYLVIPAYAETGASIPQYGCAHRVEGYNKILNADTIITVPAGTYHTFCVLHANDNRSYWNRETGIIMYEVYQQDPTLPFVKLITLKLRSME